jgi:hypothetical protein
VSPSPSLSPLPVAPRPFPGESMGGWLGRLASRYRLPLKRFATYYGLELPLATTKVGWLLLPPLPERTLKRIARPRAHLDQGARGIADAGRVGH